MLREPTHKLECSCVPQAARRAGAETAKGPSLAQERCSEANTAGPSGLRLAPPQFDLGGRGRGAQLERLPCWLSRVDARLRQVTAASRGAISGRTNRSPAGYSLALADPGYIRGSLARRHAVPLELIRAFASPLPRVRGIGRQCSLPTRFAVTRGSGRTREFIPSEDAAVASRVPRERQAGLARKGSAARAGDTLTCPRAWLPLLRSGGRVGMDFDWSVARTRSDCGRPGWGAVDGGVEDLDVLEHRVRELDWGGFQRCRSSSSMCIDAQSDSVIGCPGRCPRSRTRARALLAGPGRRRPRM